MNKLMAYILIASMMLFSLAFDLSLWMFEETRGWRIESTAIGLILFFNAALGLY